MMATGGLVVNLATGGRVTPYLTAGAGLLMNRGAAASAKITGDYKFAPLVVPDPGQPAATFHETDTVTISSASSSSAVGVVGAGIKIAGSDRWGVRIDARDYLSANTNTTTVVTTPTSQSSQPTGVFVLGFAPPLYFSTMPGTASTLSQPTNSTTFTGTGIRHQVSVTLGWYFRL
jgi:hypothetical protein